MKLKIAAIAACFNACSMSLSSADSLVSLASLDAHFDEALPLCTEFFLPNSMAKEPGFDLEGHRAEIERKLTLIAIDFRSSAARLHLAEKIEGSKDDIEVACAEYLLKKAST